MTAVTTEEQAAVRLTFGRAVRSEWLKLTTTRAVWWVAIASAVIAILQVATTENDLPTTDAAAWTAMEIASAQIVPWVTVAIYAALQATGEWTSGQYRVSFSVVPRRTTWLSAKSVAVGLYAAIVALVVLVLSTAVVFLRFGGAGAMIDPGAPEIWRAFVGGPLVFFLTAVMTVSIGALVRSSGVAVVIVVGLLVILPFAGIFGVFGLDWIGHVLSYLPSGAGDAVVGSGAFGPTTDDLGLGIGLAVLLAWAAGWFAAASVALRGRDA